MDDVSFETVERPGEAPTVPSVPRITPLHYQVVGCAGLLLIVVGQFIQGFEIVNLLVLVAGLAALGLRRPRAPLAFLILIAGVQLGAASSAAMQRPHPFPVPEAPRLFEPTHVLLAAGTLLFLGCLCRLQALQLHIVPPDPRLLPSLGWWRRRKGPTVPRPPEARPTASLRPEELAHFLLAVPLCVMIGQGIVLLLHRPYEISVLGPQLAQVALLVWICVIGLLVVSGVFSYCRRTQTDPDTARFYLQDVVWREARRDHGRMGRWRAWRLRRRKQKTG